MCGASNLDKERPGQGKEKDRQRAHTSRVLSKVVLNTQRNTVMYELNVEISLAQQDA